MGQAPYYLEKAPNLALRRALLTYVTRLLDLELDMSQLDVAVQAFPSPSVVGQRPLLPSLPKAFPVEDLLWMLFRASPWRIRPGWVAEREDRQEV